MLGDQIKKMRLAYGLNQVQLADKLGVSKQSVSNWENNNILPSVDLLLRISDFFSCSTDYLLEKEEMTVFIETKNLTLEQAIHLQQLAKDFEIINKRLNEMQK